jgi:hypothetical protein
MLLVAAVAAPLVRGAGIGGLAMGVAGWTAALALGSRARVTFGIALALLAIAATRGGVAFALSPGETLLSPAWETWSEWLGPAVLAGVLASGAGLGPFTVGPRRVPGHDETPWAAAGAALLLATLLAVQAGARFEATLGASLTDPGRDALLGGGALLGAAVVVGPRVAARSGAVARAVLGAVTTFWLAWPGLEAIPLVLGGVVPCLAASVLAHTAWRRRSLAAGLAAVVLAGGVAIGSAPMPSSASAGAAAALLLVAAFWIVATRAALATREPA